MFAIRVTYLMGRVYSAVFEDGDDKRVPEWPPHPGRLYSALVAAWGDGGAEPELRPALEWIERRAAPAVCYGSLAGDRTTVRSYVPVNDAASLPEDRPRKARSFPSAALSDDSVYFVWHDELPRELRDGLDAVLRRTSYLGHSSCPVAVELADAIPEHLLRIEPDPNGLERLRVPHPGRLAELETRYARFQLSPVKLNRPNAGRSVRYAARLKLQPEPPRGIFQEMFVLARVAGEPATLISTLQLTAAVRGALMKLGPQPSPEAISGHPDAGSGRSDRPHLALVPLAFTGAPHADGSVLGIGALLPKTLSIAEREACIGALHRVRKLTMPWGEWNVEPASAETRKSTLWQATWMRPARMWATLTPFVFDRYPRDPWGTEAQAIVADAIERIGMPRPTSVCTMKTSLHRGVPASPAFPAAPARDGKPRRFHQHVCVTFDQPVAGPLIAGAGRYYGYGLFRPLES